VHEEKIPVSDSGEVVIDKIKTQAVRIKIEYLDRLMNLVGELVINGARLQQIAQDYKIAELSAALAQFERTSIDLQEEVLKTRMVPVRHIFDRYPRMVRDFQAVIGVEARAQVLERVGRLPRSVVACVGGGSNAMGIFHPFVPDLDVELVGVEAAGEGLDTGRHSASLTRGVPGVLHGALSYLLQDDAGQVHPAHSISAGLDYPGVGPEHSFLRESGRATYVSVTDEQAKEGFRVLSRLEGIIPALETAHAVAWITDERSRWNADDVVLLCVSGRGDKDVAQVMEMGILGG
jgi:tryptophan synthase beta subunit